MRAPRGCNVPIVTHRQVTTGDGVRLRYLEGGPPVVLIYGWQQSAAELFRSQLGGLRDRYQVIALDLRGAAASGHSMGCSVLWSCYWDLFDPSA